MLVVSSLRKGDFMLPIPFGDTKSFYERDV